MFSVLIRAYFRDPVYLKNTPYMQALVRVLNISQYYMMFGYPIKDVFSLISVHKHPLALACSWFHDE